MVSGRECVPTCDSSRASWSWRPKVRYLGLRKALANLGDCWRGSWAYEFAHTSETLLCHASRPTMPVLVEGCKAENRNPKTLCMGLTLEHLCTSVIGGSVDCNPPKLAMRI